MVTAVTPFTLTDCPHCTNPWPAGATICPNCGITEDKAEILHLTRQVQMLVNRGTTPQYQRNNLASNVGINFNPLKWIKWILMIVLTIVVGYVITLGLNADSLITTMFWGINTTAFIGGVVITLLLGILLFVLFRNRI